MPEIDTAVTIQYVAWDTSANTGKTGDVANHTLRIISDGTATAPAASPAEIDATNAPGVYKVVIAAGENDGNFMTLAGVSGTASISLIPISWTNKVNVTQVSGTAQTANDNGADINAILLDTGTDGVVLANDAITSAKYDESSAYPLVSSDTGSTEVARTGADSDTLETLSDEIAALNDPTAATIADAVWDELETGHVSTGKAGEQLWTQIDAIKAKTDLISSGTLSIASTVRGSTVTVYNYTTWVVTYSNSAIDLSGRDANGAYVSVKCNHRDSDDDAILRVQEGVGLLRLNGATATAGNATLAINGAENGFTLTVLEAVTGLGTNNDLVWDLKQIETGAVTEEVQGDWRIRGAVTRAVTT